MRFEGTLKNWNDERGFGFIAPTQGGQELFVHITAFRPQAGRPREGQAVSFEVETGPQGKKRASNVEFVRCSHPAARKPAPSAAPWGTATLFAIPGFLVVYLAALITWHPPAWLALVYVAASMGTFVAYAFDKSAAQRGAWRTPENTLHVLALGGGWPGALLAQQLLRHKSAKAEFRAIFWGTVIVNITAFLAFCSPIGQPLWSAQ